MGEVVQFIPRPNPNRDQLIDQARSNYDSVFPQDIETIAKLGGPAISPYLLSSPITDHRDEPKESA